MDAQPLKARESPRTRRTGTEITNGDGGVRASSERMIWRHVQVAMSPLEVLDEVIAFGEDSSSEAEGAGERWVVRRKICRSG